VRAPIIPDNSESASAARIDAARQYFLMTFRHEAPNINRAVLLSETDSLRSAMIQIVFVASEAMKNG